jgi:quinoprotein relay system zinc metallohydrolase 2
MTESRRPPLRRSGSLGIATLLACALSALAGAAQPASAAADALPVSEIAPGVFVHFGALEDWLPANDGDVANLGFVVGTRCVAVIDSGGTPQVGQRLRAAVQQRTALPICFVINTHAHPDHVLGNAAMLAPATQFVASKRFNAAMSARGPYYLNALQRDFGIAAGAGAIVYAARQVETTAELDLGERTLTLTAWPTAHTDNDLTVYDRRTRTLFLSDLLFVRHIPVIDGNLRGWLATMKRLAGLDVALSVPGHGPASTDWPATLSAQQDYLEAVLRETRAAIKSGATLPQAVESVASQAAAPWLLAERFHRRNVTAAYAELEWEE